MDESLLGGILRLQVRLKVPSVVIEMCTHFHISPIEVMISQKVMASKISGGVPSTLKTPSPSNDLHWKWNIDPKYFI